jgi:hypothetical protein
MKSFKDYVNERKNNFDGWNSIYSLGNRDLVNSLKLPKEISIMQPILKLNKVKSYVMLTFDNSWDWAFEDDEKIIKSLLSIGFNHIDIKLGKQPVVIAYYNDSSSKKDELINNYTKKWLDDNGITARGIYKYN